MSGQFQSELPFFEIRKATRLKVGRKNADYGIIWQIFKKRKQRLIGVMHILQHQNFMLNQTVIRLEQ